MNVESPERQLLDEIREEYTISYPNCIFSLTNNITQCKERIAALEAKLQNREDILQAFLIAAKPLMQESSFAREIVAVVEAALSKENNAK